MNVTTGPKCKTYHHGDLRNALIIAAAELIEERGTLDFAMAEASRRAGVSSAAPYRHFKDREALLDAVSELAFLGLTQLSSSVAGQHKEGSEDCIIALGRAYIGYVTEHPQFYDLMWGDQSQRTPPDASRLETSGFYILVRQVQLWCERQGLENQDANELAVKLWSMAHGLAGLAMNKAIDRFLEDVDVQALFDSSAHTFLDGLQRASDPKS